ncbi:hypothetical protein C8T65DRAFT_110620 [Cerioporus squamosus]|nr:hypothetical protein C8T65DRAFT_110620 [Cerioporus squamosus]
MRFTTLHCLNMPISIRRPSANLELEVRRTVCANSSRVSAEGTTFLAVFASEVAVSRRPASIRTSVIC